jgi:hypothetical protein
MAHLKLGTWVMSKHIIDSDGVRSTEIQFDSGDNSFNFKTTQNATPVLEENKEKYNSYGDKLSLGKRGEWHHAASIPITIWEKWVKDTNGAIQKDSKLLAAYLNDPDYKYFKVAPTNL